MKLKDFHDDRFGELTNLKTAQNMFVIEESAKADKMKNEKEANKTNWESQIRDRQLREQVDRLFYWALKELIKVYRKWCTKPIALPY